MTLQIDDRKSEWEFSLPRIYPELPIVPIKYVKEADGKIRKEPLWKWTKWKDGGQSEEDRRKAIELFERGECDGLAIVCGTPVHKDGERLYFFAIDIDLPAEEAVRILGKAGIVTRFEQTLQGRLHAYFFSRSPVESKDNPIELKGHKRLIVVSPSIGYVRLNDNTPKTVDDALEIFRKVCLALGYDVEDERGIPREFAPLIDALVKIWEPGHRHNLALWLSGYLRKLGWSRKVVEAALEEIADRANDRELKDRLKALEDTYSKDPEDIAGSSRLKEELRGIVGPEEAEKIMKLIPRREPEVRVIEARGDEPSKPKTRFTVGGERLPDGSWVEVVEKDGRPHLLIYKDGEFKVVESYEVDGMVYKPPPHVMFPLPRMPECLDEDPTLWEETREFIKEHFYHLDSDVYEILTAAVAWSYFYRDLKGSTPYILFLGPWGTGKTRALEVMEVLCYHAILSTDPSPASLFRSIDLFKPTLLIDENQIMDEDVRAILASGYRYSGKVMRVIDPEADDFNSVKIFNTFAFIIYASKEEPPSDILSRSVVINCMKNLNQIRKRIDEVKVIELRTRWLAQKLRYLDRVTVTYDEFVSDNGRLQDIISPLKAMATLFGGEEAAAAIERYGRKIEAEIKALEASEPEAELVEEVARIYEERKGDAPEVIYTHELHERLKDRGWTPQLIGRRMTALGFKRYSGPGKRGYLIDPKLLTNLKIRYGLFQGRLPQT